MKRRTIFSFLAFPIAFVIVWLAIGFILWDWNPENWAWDARLSQMMFTAVFGGIGFAAWMGVA